jgi:hypothetical protein
MTQTEQERSLKPKATTAKPGIYLEIASRCLQGLLANSALQETNRITNPDLIPKVLAIMACDCAEALISESNRRIVSYKGDTFKND